MPKINFVKIIKADRKKVFEIATNFKDFQKTLPKFYPSIRVRSMRDDIAIVEEHVMLAGRELVMMTKHVTKPHELHEVFVIGGDAKGSRIKQQFIEISEGTKIIVDVDLKLKGKMKMSSMFGKNKFEQDYAKILDDFAKIAEN